MSPHFGPWSISIHSETAPRLSTLWRKRMTLLLQGALPCRRSSRAALFIAGIVAATVGFWPLLRTDTVAADAPSQDGQNRQSPDGSAKITVSGMVKLADGKPAAGAKVAILVGYRRPEIGGESYDKDGVLSLGTTDSAGKFQIDARPEPGLEIEALFAVATLRGHALGWQQLDHHIANTAVTLELPKEELIRGRLVDRDGKPAPAGVAVRIFGLGKRTRGNPSPLQFWEPPRDLPAWPAPVLTDDQGRFTLHGVNRAAEVFLQVRDSRFSREIIAVAPTAPADSQESFTVRKSQIVAGTITYADSGRVVPHARLSVFASEKDWGGGTGAFGRADEQGQFEINPFPGGYFEVSAYAPVGEPYLAVRKIAKWPDKSERLKLDVALPRGVLVRGKLTEEKTGAAISGATVQYSSQSKNPHAKDEFITGWANAAVSRPDGSFEIAVPPGKGYLLVMGPAGDFIHQETSFGALDRGKPGGSRLSPDATIPLDLPEGAQTHDVQATLRRGVTVAGQLLGPDGQAVDKAQMICLIQLPRFDFEWRFPRELVGGRFELRGCDPAAAYQVMFLDTEHEWGATAMISGAAGEKAVVKLQSCGTATARFVNRQGKPLVKHRVDPELVLTPGPYHISNVGKDGALEGRYDSYANIDRPHYWVSVETDEQGRATLPDLIPGATFCFFTSKNWDRPHVFKAEAGTKIELGDIVLDRE